MPFIENHRPQATPLPGQKMFLRTRFVHFQTFQNLSTVHYVALLETSIKLKFANEKDEENTKIEFACYLDHSQILSRNHNCCHAVISHCTDFVIEGRIKHLFKHLSFINNL